MIKEEKMSNAHTLDPFVDHIKMILANHQVPAKVEVKYRIHEKSLSTSGTISPSYRLSNLLLSTYYQVPYVWSKGQHRRAIMYYLKLQTMLNPESVFWKILFGICSSTIGKKIDYSMIEI